MSDDEYGGGGRDDFDYGGPRYPLSHYTQNQRIVTFEHQFCGRTVCSSLRHTSRNIVVAQLIHSLRKLL